MRLFEYEYECGRCRHRYELPGADLSFVYGTWLGVSVARSAVLVETLDHPVVDELLVLLGPDARDLLPEALRVAVDPDEGGYLYAFSGSPGCPKCGDRGVARFAGTSRSSPVVPHAPTTRAWSQLTQERKLQLLSTL